MPRAGRKSSKRAPPKPAASSVPAARPASSVAHQPAAPQQPGLFGQMASTAAGVAIGSTVGNAVSSVLLGGEGEQQQQHSQGPCQYELQEFVECAQNLGDVTLCQRFSEALKQCKLANTRPILTSVGINSAVLCLSLCQCRHVLPGSTSSQCVRLALPANMKFFVVVSILVHLFLATKACTEIRVTAEDQSVIIGRSMEFTSDLESDVIIEPKSKFHEAAVPETCDHDGHEPMKWKNSYKIAYINAWNLTYGTDGLNEAGLSVGALLFPGFAKYQVVPEEKCGSAISQLEFPVWILGNFGSVQEVRKALTMDWFPRVWGQTLKNETLEYLFELHYSISDKTGDGIIIEFTAEGRKVYNNTVGVFTNSPPYDFHMINIRNYIEISKYAHDPLFLGKDKFNATGQGSGLLGLPGDLTPPSRLVRAAAMLHFSDPVKTAEEAVNLAFHILNGVDIPHGVASSNEHKGLADYTPWAVARDLTHNALYFRCYEDLTIRVIYLDKVNPGRSVLKYKVGMPIGGFVDVTDKLTVVTEPHTEL